MCNKINLSESVTFYVTDLIEIYFKNLIPIQLKTTILCMNIIYTIGLLRTRI
jgi:hypothetical protein